MARNGSDRPSRSVAGHASERGQASVEWIGLVLLVALVIAFVLALAGVRFPGADLARSIAGQILCAVDLGGCFEPEDPVESAYGNELAAFIREHTPELIYEPGMVAVPVDFRRCREPSCSDGAAAGTIASSNTGSPATAFVHVVDCRPERLGESAESGYDCTGARAGSLFVQYWFYYPTSSTMSDLPGDTGFHLDDWEGYQLRIEPDGEIVVRASSHHGYNHSASIANAGSDAGGVIGGVVTDIAEATGARPEGGWGAETLTLFVSGGSHAGNARNDYERERTTPADALRMIPIETLGAGALETAFAVTPPWLKVVYSDPLSDRT